MPDGNPYMYGPGPLRPETSLGSQILAAALARLQQPLPQQPQQQQQATPWSDVLPAAPTASVAGYTPPSGAPGGGSSAGSGSVAASAPSQ